MLHKDPQHNVRWAWVSNRTGAALDETLSISDSGAATRAEELMGRAKAASAGEVRAVRVSFVLLSKEAEEELRQQFQEVARDFKGRCAAQRARPARAARGEPQHHSNRG